MQASLVFDDLNLSVPVSMGTPCDDQLVGTIHENLGELASRVCYDSMNVDPVTGKRRGRSSEKLHEHIIEVKNFSVYEHIVFTIGFNLAHLGYDPAEFFRSLANRKGIWIEETDRTADFEVTANLRAVLEWGRHTRGFNNRPCGRDIGATLVRWAHKLTPQIIKLPTLWPTAEAMLKQSWHKLGNLTDDQANITLYLYGSRGFSHEQVRHRFAISQRSTRYVDEDGSPYIEHPLVTAYLNDKRINPVDRDVMRGIINYSLDADRETYRNLVGALQQYCIEQMGITDKTTARKQARGASRGYLGNALATDMLFTTNVTGWKWILSQRKNKLADAEIRQIYTPALQALQASQYGGRFADYKLVPSPDGLGTVLAE